MAVIISFLVRSMPYAQENRLLCFGIIRGGLSKTYQGVGTWLVEGYGKSLHMIINYDCNYYYALDAFLCDHYYPCER